MLEQFFQFSTPSVLVRIMLLQDKFRGSIDQFSSGNSTAAKPARAPFYYFLLLDGRSLTQFEME